MKETIIKESLSHFVAEGVYDQKPEFKEEVDLLVERFKSLSKDIITHQTNEYTYINEKESPE